MTYDKGFLLLVPMRKKLRNEEGGKSIFKEKEKTHFLQQLLHMGENLAEIEGS